MNEASQRLLEYLRSDWSHDLKEVRELLKNGADVNAVDQMGNSPLLLERFSDDVSEFLLKKGADIHHQNHAGQSALMLTTSESFADKLIQAGVDVNATDVNGNSAVHYAYWNKKILGLLVKAGASLHHLNKMRQSLFHITVGDGSCIDTVTLKWLLKQGLDPNAKDLNGFTPLHAINKMNCENPDKLASVLIEFGANPNIKYPQKRKGLTPLQRSALVLSNREIVAQLINARSSALMLAIRNHLPEMAISLIKAGANPTISIPDETKSIMEEVAIMAHPELLAALIQGKKDTELDQLIGPYTKHFTFNQNSLDCLNFIVQNGISPVGVDIDGFLVRNSNTYKPEPSVTMAILDLFNTLIERGANPFLCADAQVCLVNLIINHKKSGIADVARRILINCLSKGMRSRWSKSDSLLHTAVEIKDVSLIESILAGNEELVFSKIAGFRTAPLLRRAVEARYEKGVSLLLSAGKRVVNDEILDDAIQYCNSERIMSMLLEHKEKSTGSPTAHDQAALMKTVRDAAERGMTRILENTIEKGVPRDYVAKTKAEVAAKRGDTDALKVLINEGLSLNMLIDGEPIFQTLISRNASVKAIQWARENGADLTLVDSSGMTLLHKSALDWRYDLQCFQILIDAGISPQVRDSKGNTALAYVSDDLRNESSSKLRLLIGVGLNPDDSGNRKHLNEALSRDDIPLAIFLLEQGADISKCDLTNKKVLAALTKTIRSRPELISSQLASLNDEHRRLLEPLVNESINAAAEADRNELPEVLREGGWPIAVASRSLIGANQVLLPKRAARLTWNDDQQKRILSSRRFRPDSEADKKFQEAIARFEKKPCTLKFGTLIRASDELFVNYWNANSILLSPHVEVASTSNWLWRDSTTGFRTEDFKYLLVRYGLAVLPGILNLASKKAGPVMKALTNVDAPVCALQVAKFMTGSTSRLARRWLSAYPESAIHGLIPPAVGKPGKDRDAAEAALRFLASKGHRESIESLASSAGAEVAASINEILSVDPCSDYMPKKFPAMPSFWDSGIHPRPLLRNGGKALPLSAVETLARMMSISTYDARTPALDEAIDAFEPVSLADFAWSVFDEWRAKGDSASNWMFQALAYMGDERCAKKLTPIIRDWPASNGQAKALLGLEILASIGTDVALAQIQSIARKNKYKPIVARADEMLTAIAEARELTTEQFEDRLVPTLGLDENGTLLLDYGKRQFFAGVDETLKPRLSDETGAAIKELPKPGKDDDKATAKLASEQWAEFKAELKPVTSIQLLRLENAMIDSRRWSGDEFLRLVAGHPLLLKSVRSLVWGVFNEKGKLVRTFRILQDGSYQDVKGKPIEVQAAALVGIPHPLSLGDETSAWKQVFADSRQGQAFAQLVRKTYRRSEDEEMDYFGLQGAVVHAKSLKGLKSMGWEMSLAGFADLIDHYYRSFPGGDVELHVEPGVSIRDFGNTAEEQTLEITVPKKLDDIEFSELIRELHTLKK